MVGGGQAENSWELESEVLDQPSSAPIGMLHSRGPMREIVRPPGQVAQLLDTSGGVECVPGGGGAFRVCTCERALVDVSYIGAADRGTMMAERPKLGAALSQVASRLGLTAKRSPGEHAGLDE